MTICAIRGPREASAQINIRHEVLITTIPNNQAVV